MHGSTMYIIIRCSTCDAPLVGHSGPEGNPSAPYTLDACDCPEAKEFRAMWAERPDLMEHEVIMRGQYNPSLSLSPIEPEIEEKCGICGSYHSDHTISVEEYAEDLDDFVAGRPNTYYGREVGASEYRIAVERLTKTFFGEDSDMPRGPTPLERVADAIEKLGNPFDQPGNPFADIDEHYRSVQDWVDSVRGEPIIGKIESTPGVDVHDEFMDGLEDSLRYIEQGAEAQGREPNATGDAARTAGWDVRFMYVDPRRETIIRGEPSEFTIIDEVDPEEPLMIGSQYEERKPIPTWRERLRRLPRSILARVASFAQGEKRGPSGTGTKTMGTSARPTSSEVHDDKDRGPARKRLP